MANPWFRMYSEFATDPKVQMLSESDQRRYVMLLCVRCNGDVTLQDDEIAFHLRISIDEWARTKAVLVDKKLIDKSANPVNWDKRQMRTDSSAERVRKYRESKRNGDVTLQKRLDNVVDTDTDTENIEANASVADTSATPQKAVCPAQAIVDLYHELMPDNPAVKVLNDQRRKLIRARWKEAAALTCEPFGYGDRESGLKAWRRFFTVCAQSDFLTGKAAPLPNKPPFVADIDFLMSPSGFAKCLENKYHRE